MIIVGILVFFFLITDPAHVGLPPPVHHKDSNVGGESVPASDQLNGAIPNGKPVMNGRARRDNLPNSVTTYKDGAPEEKTRLTETSFTTDDTSALIPPEDSRAAPQPESPKKAIGFFGALMIPGVIEFSLALFFNKLVAYTFLFWLPFYIFYHPIDGKKVGEQKADLLSTFYDVGGIFGGIATGAVSDILDSRAISCVIMMYFAIPTLFVYRSVGHESYALTVCLVMLCGLFINGPYAVITTAVSNDLGTHKSLKDDTKAKATVGAIIDGMGSLGAACGPLITGWVSDEYGWDQAFFVLMTSCFLASLSLTRLLIKEVRYLYNKVLGRWRKYSNKREKQ
jgi:hypothetical protein